MNVSPSRVLEIPLLVLLLLASRDAVAQESAPPPAPAPSTHALSSGWFDPPAPTPAPSPPPPPPAPASDAPSEPEAAPSRCRLGDHAGIPLADATTAAELVCAEIARLGPAPAARYRVSLGKLGSSVVLSAEREDSGKTPDFRQMRLSGIEEVSVAAPKIARALVLDVTDLSEGPVEETQRADSHVVAETHVPPKPSGSTHFALGLLGLFGPLDQGVTVAPGLDIEVHHETGDGRWDLGGAVRFGAGGGNDSPTMVFFGLSTGARYFMNEGDVSPYLGGGLAWSYWNLNAPGANFQGDGNGLGGYLDAGFEIMRTHHAHVAFGARVDLPFFALKDNGFNLDNISCTSSCSSTSSSYYFAPLSLEVKVTF